MCVWICYITHSALFTYFNWKKFTRYSLQIISETPGPFIYLSSCTFVECTCNLCAYHCVTIHNNVFTRDISSKLTTKQWKLGFRYVCVCGRRLHHWCGKHCSVPKLRSNDPSSGMSCEPRVKEQKIKGKREERMGEDCPLMCGDVYNLLNAARLLLFLNLTSKFHWPFSISIVTLTAVRSAHHNSLSGHSLVAVRGWILGHRVCFTCLIYLKNTPAHSTRAIFFILQQNKSKVHLKSSVSAFSENQIQLCMIAEW